MGCRMASSRPTSLGELDILPRDTIEVICSFCSPGTLGLFARASRGAEEASALIRLLVAAVNAEPESYQQADATRLAAIAILKRHPELLFVTEIVTDHFGRKIEATPYQLLLGAGDTWALKQVHASIIPCIENGNAIAEAQFKTQFPHCPWPPTSDMSEEALYDDRNRVQIAQVIAQLKVIVTTISADPCTNGQATLDETTKAVADLCQIFAPKEGEVIQTGLHFPLGIMKEIYKVYDTQFDPWSGDQLAFFSRAVIGAAEAALTAVDGQCCKNGLGNLDMEKGPDRRDGLFCPRPRGIPPALAPLTNKLGRTMFVDPSNGDSCALSSSLGVFDWYNKSWVWRVDLRGGGRCEVVVFEVGRLDNLCRTKAEAYGSYIMRPRFEASTHRPAMSMTIS